MIIIKPGRRPNNTFRGACRACGCVIECHRDEVCWLQDRPWEDASPTVKCPTDGCGKTIYVKSVPDA